MKTSDEIKKGLKCCASVNAHCESCPFRTGIGTECIRHMTWEERELFEKVSCKRKFVLQRLGKIGNFLNRLLYER